MKFGIIHCYQFLIFLPFFSDGFNLERFRDTLRQEVRRGIEDAKKQTKKWLKKQQKKKKTYHS